MHIRHDHLVVILKYPSSYNAPTKFITRPGPNEVSIRNAGAVMQIVGGKSWQKGQSYDNTASAPGSNETALIALRDRKFSLLTFHLLRIP